MGTLTLRRWLVLSLVSIFVIPVALFNVAAMIDGGAGWWSSANSSASPHALDLATTIIGADTQTWNDPAWRRSTGTRLSAMGISAQLYDAQGNLLGDMGSVPSNQHGSGRWWGSAGGPSRVVELRSATGKLMGTIDFYDTSSGSHQPFLAGVLAGFAGLGLALIGTGSLLGRYVVRPLEAVSTAAHQIADGDLDFAVPKSRVSEVDEVSDAFHAMGNGLKESIARQVELEEERRFFVGAIAHDLRTPLFSLRGYLQGLESGIAKSPEKVAQYVAVCTQKANQIERLVSDLAAFTRVEFLEQTLRFAPVNLASLVEEAVTSTSVRTNSKNVRILTELSPGDSTVDGDADLLERVLSNLLDNAVRHTPEGSFVTIELRRDADRLIVTVADSGPGIPERDIPHLFDPFFRGDESRNPETGGVGLGLTIARRIMRAHGGDLRAENRREGGAIFTLRLPALPETSR